MTNECFPEREAISPLRPVGHSLDTIIGYNHSRYHAEGGVTPAKAGLN